MTNHETIGAGGPERTDPLAGAEAEAEREASAMPGQEVSEAAGTGRAPRVSTAHRRTVTAAAGGANDAPPHAGDAVTRPPAVPDGPAGNGRPTVSANRVEITRGGEIDVEARTIQVDRGGIGTARAHAVDVQRGGIGRLDAVNVTVTQGGVGFARANRLSIDMGGIGGAMTGRLDLTRGGARSIVAGEAHLERAGVQTLVANRVTMHPGSGAFVVIARRVDGEIRTLLDWRGALAFGAALGLVLGIVRRGSAARRRG